MISKGSRKAHAACRHPELATDNQSLVAHDDPILSHRAPASSQNTKLFAKVWWSLQAKTHLQVEASVTIAGTARILRL
jgi:hypothetical protein